MTTKRPSIVVLSEIIQQYAGSDYDAIVGLANNLDAILDFMSRGAELDAAIEAANAVILADEDYVKNPLMDYPVDFSSEGFVSETTLGGILTAFAILTKMNEASINTFTAPLAAAATAAGTEYDPVTGVFNVSLDNVKKVLDALGTACLKTMGTDNSEVQTNAQNRLEFSRSGTIVVADLATHGAPINYIGGPAINLPNDGFDADTDVTLAPSGITAIYNFGDDGFDFTQLKLGDVVTLRVRLNVTTTVADQAIQMFLRLAETTGSERVLVINQETVKTAGLYAAVGEITFYMKDIETLNEIAHVRFASPNDCDITVVSFETFIQAKG